MNLDEDQENTDCFAERNNQDDRHLIPARSQMSKWGHYIEPAVFIMSIGGGLFDTVAQNVIERQYCTSVLQLSPSYCDANTSISSQPDVQKYTSTFSMIRTAVETLYPCLLTFFIGPWSDTYGRKPLLISCGLGYCVLYTLWTLASSMPLLNPSYFLLFSIPFALGGAQPFLFLSIFCYVCDVTTIQQRSIRLGTLQAAMMTGGLIGIQLCPIIKEHYGYTAVFTVATVLIYLSLIYSSFFLQESVIPSEIERNSVSANPFRLSHLRNLIDTCYTRQSPRTRFKIALCTIIATFSILQMTGEMQVMFLFMQRRLNATLEDYSRLSSFSIAVMAIGSLVGPSVFVHFLKYDELFVLSIATFMRILSALVIVFGYQVWHLYLAKLLNASLGVSSPLNRLFLSRIIPADELGKVFSLMSTAESSTPFLGSLFYTFVYNATVNTYPEGVFILSALLMLASLVIITILIELHLSEPKTDYITQQTPAINT